MDNDKYHAADTERYVRVTVTLALEKENMLQAVSIIRLDLHMFPRQSKCVQQVKHKIKS
jgi:hypothetical protein